MVSPASMHPELSERDLEPVRELILGLVEDANRRERERQLALASATWINAFTSFKRLRKKIGLPRGKAHELAYGAILGALKASGKMLLSHILQKTLDPETTIGVTADDFEACVQELQEDDMLLEQGLLSADLKHVEAAFA